MEIETALFGCADVPEERHSIPVVEGEASGQSEGLGLKVRLSPPKEGDILICNCQTSEIEDVTQ